MSILMSYAWNTCLAGWRSYAARMVFILGFFLVCGAHFAGGFSGRHPQTVALDMGLTGIRLMGVLLVVFWAQELLAKEIDKRTIFMSITYPVAKGYYLLGRYLGIVAMLASVVLILGVVLMLSVKMVMPDYVQGTVIQLGVPYIMVLLGIVMDLAVITAFVFLLSSFATSTFLPFGLGLSYALVARSYGSVFAGLLEKNSATSDLATQYSPIMTVISWLVPDLSKLDIRVSALYGVAWQTVDFYTASAASLCYAALVLCIAIFIFSKREFN